MPCVYNGRGPGGDSDLPQSSAEVSSMHHVPRGNPRVQHEQRLLPAIEGAFMRETTGHYRISRLVLLARCLGLAAVLLFPAFRAYAQDDEEQKGVDQGNYNIRQSIEFGGRFVDTTGDKQSYDTFVNLQQGPRLLGFTTEMRSLNHSGGVSDRQRFREVRHGPPPDNHSL